MKKGRFLDRQTGRQEQRMRNILVVLAMFVCTSICLGDTGQTITIGGDIDVRAETMKLEHDARIAAMKKKEAELKAAREARAAQRKQAKLELEREAEYRAEYRAERAKYRAERAKNRAECAELARAECAEYRAKDRAERTEFDKLWAECAERTRERAEATLEEWAKDQSERRATLKLMANLWRDKPLSEQEKQLVDCEKQLLVREKTRLSSSMEEWAKDQSEKRATLKLMANLWRDKPLSEQEKQLVDWEKQLCDREKTRLSSSFLLRDERGELELSEARAARKEAAELEVEWEELDAEREALDKRLAEEREARMKEEDEVWMKKLEEWEKEKEREKLELLEMEQRVKDGKHMEQCLEARERARGAVYPDIAGNGSPELNGKALTDDDGNAIWKDPNNNHLFINPGVKVGNAYGAKMNKASVDKNKDNKDFLSMTKNEVIVTGGEFGCGNTNGNIAGAWADNDIDVDMNISSNTVIITERTGIGNVLGGRTKYGTVITGRSNIGNVFGGRAYNGTVSSNTVRIEGRVDIDGKLDIGGNVFGGYISKKGTVSSNTVIIEGGRVKSVYGGYVSDGTVSSNTVIIMGGSDTGDVYGGRTKYGTVSSNTVIIMGGSETGNVLGGDVVDGTVSSNTVRIEGGTVRNVYGGYILSDGTATGNTVEITNTTVGRDVCGARILRDIASSNEVTINDGKVEGSVLGGYIEEDGTATGNKVNLTNMVVVGNTSGNNVFGAKINGSGIASKNTVTITDGMIGFKDSVVAVGNVYGGYIKENGEATGNTVTINNGNVVGNVFGGYVGGKGKGKAINNTITITGSSKFSERTILCGGVATNNAVTGNTLTIIETKRVVVNGISNFENYNFYLTKSEIEGSLEPILITKSGGCSWNIDTDKYTEPCPVDLSNKKIYIYTNDQITLQAVCILINSKRGFKNPPSETSKLSEDKSGGEWVTYEWKLNVAKNIFFGDDGEYLTARLIAKGPGSKGKLVAGGYGTLLGLVNQGTDFVVSRIEEAERLVGGGEGEIEAFFGVGANKSRYNTGTEMEMVGTSMIGGIAIGMEVGGKGQSPEGQSSKGQSPKELVTGVFVEHGNGDSEIICEKKSKGSNEYTGVGVLGKYNLYEDEERGRKIYGEAVLRTGCVSNKFKGNGLKDDRGKELEYEAGMMYEGCAGGLGYKHKVSEKIDLDWGLRYMFGRQDGKDVTMSDGRIVKFENVISNRIKVGVRGTYRDIEQIKPYVGIWYEHELGGKIKAVVQDAQDQVKIPASSFGGWTGVGELGVSGKVWKFGVDISGQGYLGVRKGFGGMLKLKYAFGKDAHRSKASRQVKRNG